MCVCNICECAHIYVASIGLIWMYVWACECVCVCVCVCGYAFFLSWLGPHFDLPVCWACALWWYNVHPGPRNALDTPTLCALSPPRRPTCVMCPLARARAAAAGWGGAGVARGWCGGWSADEMALICLSMLRNYTEREGMKNRERERSKIKRLGFLQLNSLDQKGWFVF